MGKTISIRSVTSAPSKLHELTCSDIEDFVNVEACPCCKASKFEVIATLGDCSKSKGLRLLICDSCCHLFYDKMPTDRWLDNFYTNNWDSYGRNERFVNNSVIPFPESHFSHLLELKLNSDAAILDFGCGFGQGLLGLRDLGFKNLFGVEPSKHRFEIASSLNIGKVAHGSIDQIENLRDEGQFFDCIISRHVFEHLRAPLDHLQQLKEFLKPNGIVILLVPVVLFESPVGSLMFLPHLHTFSSSSMAAMFRNCGLSAYVYTENMTKELVMIGSKEADWKPQSSLFVSAGKNNVPKDAIVSFLQNPWIKSETNHFMISYGHPSKFQSLRECFQLLSNHASSLVRFFENVVTLVLSGKKRHGAMLRYYGLLRKFWGSSSIQTNDIIECKVSNDVGVENSSLRLVSLNGKVPVFIK